MHDNCDCAKILVGCSRCGRDAALQPACALEPVFCQTCLTAAPSEDRS